ncbi:MAG TPA: hypothetical protein VKZ96_08035 [Thermomicrobiales bacterium]|nr:hypothetical protein [Thermomicrobiales bacterium]
MSLLLTFAFACHMIGIFTMVGFGLTYLLRQQFMPYHRVALGSDWTDVPREVQILILALMRGIAGGALAVAVLALLVLMIPFRSGEVWAFVAVPLGGLILSAGALYAMRLVAANTPAAPPYQPIVGGAVLGIIGFLLSLLDALA